MGITGKVTHPLQSQTENGETIARRRTRCLDCYRPIQLCFCDAIPSVANQTSVCILQHRRERFHPFNTARIVNHALQDCELLVGHNQELATRFDAMLLNDRVGLLFPGDQAHLLSDVSRDSMPRQIIVPDGTWHHVKTLMRDISRLQKLPRYCLSPTTPGQYRIRREPNEHSLSTLEATVASLQVTEPDTPGLIELLDAFDRMVTDQLKHPTSNWRANSRRRVGSPNVPRALTGDENNIVVAYGEHECGMPHDANRPRHPMPVVWKAVRWSTGEFFQCTIRSDSLHDPDFREHLRLRDDVLESAVDWRTFQDRWRAFLRPSDHVVVRLPSTAALLRNVQADCAAAIVLKSIDVPNQHRSTANLPLPFDRSRLPDDSRASQRLLHAVEIVASIRHHYPVQ